MSQCMIKNEMSQEQCSRFIFISSHLDLLVWRFVMPHCTFNFRTGMILVEHMFFCISPCGLICVIRLVNFIFHVAKDVLLTCGDEMVKELAFGLVR